MTLTQVATLTRHTILITSIAITFGIAAFVGYRIWYAYYQASLPKVEEKPDTKFGILPLPDFPKAYVSSSNFSYSLDTKTGDLPKLEDVGFEKLIKVYFTIKPYATLLSPDRSQALAEKFQILSPPETLTETSYKFRDQDKTLLVDLDSGNFTYTREYAKEATISAKESFDDDSKLVADFKNILLDLGVLKEELKQGRTKITLLKKEDEKYIPTTLRTESEAVQISLWPAHIDKKPIFTADFNRASVSAIVFGSANILSDYLSIDFTFWPVDQTTFATYPLKSPTNAFEDLRSGKGVVLVEPKKPQVSITSLYLGYYMSENYSPYLLPIFVFEGPEFVSYVSAIPSEFQSPAR